VATDQDAGEERADDVAEREGPEADPPDDEAHRKREEYRELGMVPQRADEVRDHAHSTRPVTGVCE
jgi:hypothetical protein